MEGERARAFGLEKACPPSYAIPGGARKPRDGEGKVKRGRYGARREKKGRSWRGNGDVSSPAPRAKEDCRWKEGGLDGRFI